MTDRCFLCGKPLGEVVCIRIAPDQSIKEICEDCDSVTP